MYSYTHIHIIRTRIGVRSYSRRGLGNQRISLYSQQFMVYYYIYSIVLWRRARARSRECVYAYVHKSFRLTNKPCIFASKLLFTHVNGTSIKDTTPTRQRVYTDSILYYIPILYTLYTALYTLLKYIHHSLEPGELLRD